MSNLHRLLCRHGLNKLPKDEAKPREKKKFKKYEIGYFHITDFIIANKKKLYIFLAIDRTSKYAEIYNNKKIETTEIFLKNLICHLPYKINTILTDNGAQFTYKFLLEHFRSKKKHPFDIIYDENTIEHRLTKFYHPWTNGQVEVFNRVLKDHTTKEFYYDNEQEIKRHIMSFLLLYNFQRPLRSLKYLSPVEYLCLRFEEKPELFQEDPNQKIWGLNKYCKDDHKTQERWANIETENFPTAFSVKK